MSITYGEANEQLAELLSYQRFPIVVPKPVAPELGCHEEVLFRDIGLAIEVRNGAGEGNRSKLAAGVGLGFLAYLHEKFTLL